MNNRDAVNTSSSPGDTVPKRSISWSVRPPYRRPCKMRSPPSAWATPICLPAHGAWARRRPPASWPKPSTVFRVRRGTPCGECDICRQIAGGDDVDVLEIDGASNRGIDEIRQLRSNVGIRPSRARFKIYIIDEVHMLTKEAFNALLKTLEEPPDHVKFIFCTTEPSKIPITVLSRCQRFDFCPVGSAQIVERLQYIVQQEGASAQSRCVAVAGPPRRRIDA